MSIDKIFLKQFKANNKFIDAMVSIINNYLQISDMKKLLSCCQLICNSKDIFEENNKILNGFVNINYPKIMGASISLCIY